MAVNVSGKVGEVAQDAKQVARKAHPWLKPIVKCGYVAKGLIYGMIGVLALLAATGYGGKATNQRGALHLIADQPFGELLLVAMAVGLFGYALWRLLMAIFNPEQRKPIKRIAYGITAIAYFAIGFAALAAAAGDKSNNTRRWAGLVAETPGRILAVIVGLILIAVALAQFINAFKAGFLKILETERMSEASLKLATLTGRIGIAARALVFLTTGWILIQAAIDRDPGEAGGVEKALKALSLAPAGPYVLGAAGIGLIAYGVFMVVEARFRQIASA